MKWTLLTGAFGLAIGFFVGSAREEAVVEKEAAAVVKSERRMNLRGGGDRETRSSKERTWEAERAMQEAEDFGWGRSEISMVRLMKWILELEETEFPEVLTKLQKLDDPNPDPFAEKSKIGLHLTLAMARWYELEGESVLEWISAKPEILAGGNRGKLIQDLIQDGYQRNPTRSFQLLKKYAETIAQDLVIEGVSDNLFFEIGRWSEDLEGEFNGIVKLFEIFGAAVVPSDPFADDSATRDSLMRGIVHAGREEEARLVFESGMPDWLQPLNELSTSEKTTKLAEKGWRNLKTALDSGELENAPYRAEKVLNEWAAEDPEEALSWYLAQRFEDTDRASQIKDALFSKAFDHKREGGVRVDEAIEFLDRLQGAGEPVDEAYFSLMEHGVKTEEWGSLEKLKSRVSLKNWELGMNLVKKASTELEYLYLDDGARLQLPRIDQQNIDVLERFGLFEEVEESIAVAKEGALQKLREMVEGE